MSTEQAEHFSSLLPPLTAQNILLATLFAWLIWSKTCDYHLWYNLQLWFEYFTQSVPTLDVELSKAEANDDGVDTEPTTSAMNLRKENLIQCYDPSTRQLLGTVPAMTPNQVEDLCKKAKQAQIAWARDTTFAQRRQVLRTMQKYIIAHMTDICRVASRDSGKPKVDAFLGEVLTTCEKIRCIVQWGQVWLRPSYRATGPLMMHKDAYVEYVPLGVIGVIAPWNYPFHNVLNHIISGLFAGNAVVVKVSEHTSWSSQYYLRIVHAALAAHGYSPDLVQVVTGFGEAGSALVKSASIDKVLFTGSPGIGRKVMEAASSCLKPVVLELGGKDAMVVMDDVKVDDVTPWAMRGCFQNAGQNCVGIERILVYESVHDKFVKAIVPQVEALRQGVPVACGKNTGNVDCAAMVTEEQLDIIQQLVDDAVKHGAKVMTGGKRATDVSSSQGNFYQPTVLVNVTPDMRIYKEEVFGPVMTIVKVLNDSDEKCLELVNDSSFGLGSSVYCGDSKRGLALGRQIRSGMLCINDFGSNYLVQALPFGGVNESGFGRFGGPEGLQALCLERSILVDKINKLRTTIPPALQYPMHPEKSMGFAMSLAHLFYEEGIVGKIKGIIGLIKYG